MTIKNIIFDLGNVVIDVNAQRTWHSFSALGILNPQHIFEVTGQHQMVDLFECGHIGRDDFFNALRDFANNKHISDDELHNAWCAMLGAVPQYRFDILEKLRPHYRLFVLSNTNSIHYEHFSKIFAKNTSGVVFDKLFEKTYYSFNIGMRKPDEAIFEFVLSDSALNPDETVFIDDLKNNIEAASRVGLLTHHANTPDSAWQYVDNLIKIHVS